MCPPGTVTATEDFGGISVDDCYVSVYANITGANESYISSIFAYNGRDVVDSHDVFYAMDGDSSTTFDVREWLGAVTLCMDSRLDCCLFLLCTVTRPLE